MAVASGKFILTNGDDDIFDKICAAVGNSFISYYDLIIKCWIFINCSTSGISAEQIALSRKLKPTMEYSRDADGNYKTIVTAPGLPDRVQSFKLDVEFEETAIGGRKVKVLS